MANEITVRRKYNLSRIGRPYESIDIEVTCESIEEAVKHIHLAWKAYCKALVDGLVD